VKIVLLILAVIVGAFFTFMATGAEWEYPPTGVAHVEIRPSHVEVESGETAWLELYAVADTRFPQPFAAADVVLTMSPGIEIDMDYVNCKDQCPYGYCIAGCAVEDTGPYRWLVAGFMIDTCGDAWNNSLTDGDAWFTAWSNWEEFPEATPEGLLIGRVPFRATADSGSELEVRIDSFGEYTWTVLYDDEVGAWPNGTYGDCDPEDDPPICPVSVIEVVGQKVDKGPKVAK
jgi:hypothetical protein